MNNQKLFYFISREIKSENISLDQFNQYNRKKSRMSSREFFKHEDNYDDPQNYENSHHNEIIKTEKSGNNYIEDDEKYEEPPEDLTKPK